MHAMVVIIIIIITSSFLEMDQIQLWSCWTQLVWWCGSSSTLQKEEEGPTHTHITTTPQNNIN
jgi:hypothetical protein